MPRLITGVRILVACVAIALLCAPGNAVAKFKLLYAFKGGSDGSLPDSNLLLDTSGGLFGTTENGGSQGCGGSGCGTIFKITAGGKESVLYAFTGQSDGAFPMGNLVNDDAGNLYGTTANGGAYGAGVVFEITSNGVESVFHPFTGGSDGGIPIGGLIADKSGNFYGATAEGGSGCGVVFKLMPNGKEKTLYTFTCGTDGAFPNAVLFRDGTGNLYSTTNQGGTDGDGIIFELTPKGIETTLYSFTNGTDGGNPLFGVIRDDAGNLYTDMANGGTYGYGAVFKLNSKGNLTALYSFRGQNDGLGRYCNLLLDKSGNIYGEAGGGGGDNDGTVFVIPARGKETVLHSFKGEDGRYPTQTLTPGGHGHYYGIASYDGMGNNGVVFELSE